MSRKVQVSKVSPSQTMVQLRQLAKEQGLSGFSRLKKDELVELLRSHEKTVPNGEKKVPLLREQKEVEKKVPGKEVGKKVPNNEKKVPRKEVEKKIPLKRGISNDKYEPDFLAKKWTGESRFVKVAQLGRPGKEGVVFLVVDDNANKYAMKTFKPRKSGNTLEKEAYFQHLASQKGISPAIIEYNPDKKYIVMELLSRTLLEVIAAQNNVLTEVQQRQIIDLYRKLDDLGIVINDGNPLNVMEKNGRFYLIDYGFAKFSTHKDFQKYTLPNYELMPLGLLIWLKGKVPTKGWTYFRQQIKPEIYTSMEISSWP